MLEYIEALAVHNSKTSSADRAYWAGFAALGACPVTPCGIGIIYFPDTLTIHIADIGGELATSMDVSIRKDGNKVKCRAAPEPGTAPEEFFSLVMQDYVDEIVFQAYHRIGLRGFDILYQEISVFVTTGDGKLYSLTNLG